MGKDGSMYMLTESLQEVDKLGNIVHGEMKMEEEGPPKVELLSFRLVNFIRVQKVLIDDTSKVLYQKKDEEVEFVYVRTKILENMATKNKVLYVYVRTPILVGQNMILLDKYGLEWEMLLPSEVK